MPRATGWLQVVVKRRKKKFSLVLCECVQVQKFCWLPANVWVLFDTFLWIWWNQDNDDDRLKLHIDIAKVAICGWHSRIVQENGVRNEHKEKEKIGKSLAELGSVCFSESHFWQ